MNATKPVKVLRDALLEIKRQLDETQGRSTSNAYSVIDRAVIDTEKAAEIEAMQTPSADGVTLRNWLLRIHDNELSIGDRLQGLSSRIALLLEGAPPAAPYVIREQGDEVVELTKFLELETLAKCRLQEEVINLRAKPCETKQGDHPDTTLLDFVIPVLSGDDDADANARTLALMEALMRQLAGREAIKSAMEAYQLAKEKKC